MASSSRSHPNKKRRLDSSTVDDAPGPSSEVLPLVAPNLIPKSSNDPNRGMYPSNGARTKKIRFVCPTFCKASKLFKQSESKARQDVEHCGANNDISLPGVSNQEAETVEMKTLETSQRASTSNSTPRVKSKSKKAAFSTSTLANKIFNYFKPVPSTSKPKKCEIACTSATAEENNSNPVFSEDVPRETHSIFKDSPNYYGLFGDSNLKEETNDQINYFESLPDHIIEAILCQIPFKDLMKCKLVCSVWNDIISNPKFMEWKKIYYGTKFEVTSYRSIFLDIWSSYDPMGAADCFPILIKYMAEAYCRKPSSDMSSLMANHPKAILADAVLTERFPELQAKESRPWCVFVIAMVLSESVDDVYSLYQCLFTAKAQISVHDVTDVMYCTATFLLFFMSGVRINHGLHYRVYYALYLIENNLPSENVPSLKLMKGLKGQQSLHSYSDTSKSTLTYEQIRILNHCFGPDQVIKIVALAGTGKTTTLIHLARLYPQVRYLNVMFNKAVCDEAKHRFPPNVTCRTAHSLAFSIFGRRLKHKTTTKIRPHDLVTLMQFHASSQLQVHSYAKLVLNTIESFEVSAALEISLDHVPLCLRDLERRPVSTADRNKLLKDAIAVWNKMIDKDDLSAKITHDVYLKLYQLSKPKLSGYDCLMVDEAQDCNPAMLDILLSQNLPVILVGDPNQQIYGFRGADNALQSVEATHVYHLTKSFRFGSEIAYIASCCLEVLKLNSNETLVGNEKPSYMDGRVEGQYAIIARTNVQIFNEAVRMCCFQSRKEHEPVSVQGAFAGGITGYGFDQILDIYKLRANSRTSNGSRSVLKDKFISNFKTFSDLYNYAKNVEDSDLLTKIDIVNQHDIKLLDYIRIIKEKCSHPMELANVIFSTAHKSKGLEFDTVCLTDDYQIGRIPSDMNNPAWSEETSVLYVALTRAKKSLLLPEKLIKVLLIAQEKFEYPISSKSLLASVSSLQCVNCGDAFVPHTALILARRQYNTSSGRTVEGGPLCMRCSTMTIIRPEVRVEMVVMYLDPMDDRAHQSFSCLVGPLPNDPPIEHANIDNDMDIVYIINVNV